jgi:hypothetical protein
MAIIKRRTKLICFRVSDEEYEKLQGACEAEGARSISEFARQRTILSQNDNLGDPAKESFVSGAKELTDTMRELNRQLGQLVSIAQSANGPK